jgi:hypothetical protein
MYVLLWNYECFHPTFATTEQIITAATFTAGLLKTGGDTHHRRFVLRTDGDEYEPLVRTGGENLDDYHRRLVTRTGYK